MATTKSKSVASKSASQSKVDNKARGSGRYEQD